jgi:hypothetical protein
MFGGISCEKSRFYAKKSYFIHIAEGGANFVGVFRVKNHDFTPKNHVFSNFRGARAGCAPPPPPWILPWPLLFVPVGSSNQDSLVSPEQIASVE